MLTPLLQLLTIRSSVRRFRAHRFVCSSCLALHVHYYHSALPHVIWTFAVSELLAIYFFQHSLVRPTPSFFVSCLHSTYHFSSELRPFHSFKLCMPTTIASELINMRGILVQQESGHSDTRALHLQVCLSIWQASQKMRIQASTKHRNQRVCKIKDLCHNILLHISVRLPAEPSRVLDDECQLH